MASAPWPAQQVPLRHFSCCPAEGVHRAPQHAFHRFPAASCDKPHHFLRNNLWLLRLAIMSAPSASTCRLSTFTCFSPICGERTVQLLAGCPGAELDNEPSPIAGTHGLTKNLDIFPCFMLPQNRTASCRISCGRAGLARVSSPPGKGLRFWAGKCPCCASPLHNLSYSFFSRWASVALDLSMAAFNRVMLRPAASRVCCLRFTLSACAPRAQSHISYIHELRAYSRVKL